MVYYRINARITNYKELVDAKENKVLPITFANASVELLQRTKNKCCIYVSRIERRTKLECAAIGSNEKEIREYVQTFLEILSMKVEKLELKETTIHHFWAMIATGEGYDFIEDRDEIIHEFHLELILRKRMSIEYRESVVADSKSYEVIQNEVENYLCKNSLQKELDRIYQSPLLDAVKGNPVHYMIDVEQLEIGRQISGLLLMTLFANGRLEHQRYARMHIRSHDFVDDFTLQRLYELNEGGALVVRFSREEEDYNGVQLSESIIKLVDCAKQYRSKVLTIFLVEKKDTKTKEAITENLGPISLIHIYDEIAYGDQARNYLKKIAAEQGIEEVKTLSEVITDEKKGYSAKDLQQLFDDWLDKYLKYQVYPQYAEIEVSGEMAKKKKPKGSAYAELEQMIGLTEAKKIINQALDYYKAQKLLKEKGMKSENLAMHMVFSGTPGTAKTSVARLFAQIMKENGVLYHGDLFEVGRADLVGKYVGWTAQIVKEKFKAARGSVLFIDEAYSLLDDKGGMYGDEAINTIVQEMENNRDDTIVIFAGYSDEMEKFLERNPGLRSRIAFHVHFEDYNTEELCEIGKMMVTKNGMKLDGEAEKKLEVIFDAARQQEDFGNGRYVRNTIEKARMKQASRLMRMDIPKLTSEDIATFLAEDFEVPKGVKKEKQRIGFVGGTI